MSKESSKSLTSSSEVPSLRTTKSKTFFDQETKKFTSVVTSSDQHCKGVDGCLQDVNENLVEKRQGEKGPVALKYDTIIKDDGSRVVTPRPEFSNETIKIDPPDILVDGKWKKANIGSPTAEGNIQSWDGDIGFSLATIWSGVKETIVLKEAMDVRFGITLKKLTLIDGDLYGEDQKLVGHFDKSWAVDVNNNPVELEVSINSSEIVVRVTTERPSFPVTIDPTLTLQPDGTVGEDTNLVSTNPDSPSGTGTGMAVGDGNATVSQAYRTLVRFTGISGIPSGSTITSVTLSLWEWAVLSSAAFSVAVNMHKILLAWVEAEATWNSWKTGSAWGTAGCSAVTDRSDTVSATITLDQTAAGAFVSWSSAGLVADVQSWVDGEANNGWMIRSAGEFNGAGSGRAYNEFRTSEYTTEAQRPKLVVEYTLPAPATGSNPVSCGGSGISIVTPGGWSVGCSN